MVKADHMTKPKVKWSSHHPWELCKIEKKVLHSVEHSQHPSNAVPKILSLSFRLIPICLFSSKYQLWDHHYRIRRTTGEVTGHHCSGICLQSSKMSREMPLFSLHPRHLWPHPAAHTSTGHYWQEVNCANDVLSSSYLNIFENVQQTYPKWHWQCV